MSKSLKSKALIGVTALATAFPVLASETSSATVSVDDLKTSLVDPIINAVPVSLILGVMALGVTAPLGIWLYRTFGRQLINKITEAVQKGKIKG